MRSGEKTRVIGDDGHFGAVVACLIKHAILEHHEYIWILFESRVKVLIVALGLRGGAVKPLGNLSRMLLQMDGLIFIKAKLREWVSRAEELGAYPARRTVHAWNILLYA